ncbi:MAG: hypothetical protein K2H17_09675 [Duncaniella sp.]|uniref:hypothetical protein n=1 Tax=Duncaniella sp. TaxID=2518496 RepID=UPI0023C16429|nr:hypothetical protein [Duncaniella sp.]MDE5989654.1 hypothetical protein [Duncaniella sp.]
MSGNLRSSANPDILSGLLSKFIYKSAYGCVSEMDMSGLNVFVIVCDDESGCSDIGLLIRRKFRYDLVVSSFPHDDSINRVKERSECILRLNGFILTFYPVNGAVSVGDITIDTYSYI